MEKQSFADQWICRYFDFAPGSPLPSGLYRLRDAYFAGAAVEAVTHSHNGAASEWLAREVRHMTSRSA